MTKLNLISRSLLRPADLANSKDEIGYRGRARLYDIQKPSMMPSGFIKKLEPRYGYATIR